LGTETGRGQVKNKGPTKTTYQASNEHVVPEGGMGDRVDSKTGNDEK